ncbi:hypothetical protein [Priestia taiwanensis]|uniref:Uncharacterized protein n=1 Tax=Priestia taiwanensis TaxID=1347902 RepID=A0A917ERE5_9BACI|nr:hypothetical protein [Priestia taiwanensis]MBM7363914.1 nitrogen fixation/metabolism regulation signal transduction histidine kinase [Priestia taiwanensis]GGE70065.1 hypothetical protein GCM10007140_20050 [Priestia taiwanensis]
MRRYFTGSAIAFMFFCASFFIIGLLMNKVEIMLHVFSKLFFYIPIAVYVGTFVFELIYHAIRKYLSHKLAPWLQWVIAGAIVLVLVCFVTHKHVLLLFQAALGLVGYYLGTKISDKTLSFGVILLTVLLFIVSYMI